MKKLSSNTLATTLSMLALPAFIQTAHAATAPIDEIIVTAQKHSETINSIGMSINAIVGDDLKDRGIVNTADLNKAVSGLSVVPNGTGLTGAPIYTLRGIGFNEKSLGALSAVSFAHDEIPLPYVYMTAGPSLDLQQIEVLKGPQGTLYGQNSTGGAINFISNKPTATFSAGGDLSYSRFNRVDASGFISGPVADKLTARLALRSITAGDWQQSASRPGDELGSVNSQAERLLVDWNPANSLSFELSINGWQDHSESQAAQLIGVNPSIGCNIFAPGCPALSPASYPAFNAVLNSPNMKPSNPRVADWNPGLDYKNNNRFGQIALRADWDLNDDITLTSLTAASKLDYQTFTSASGTPTSAEDFGADGSIRAYSQELRLAGEAWDDLHWITGVNFAHDKINDNQHSPDDDSTLFTFFGLKEPHILANEVRKSQAVFASGDYDLTPTVNLTGGVRYTKVQLKFNGCLADGGDGSLAAFAPFLAGAPVGVVAPGNCVTLLNETGPNQPVLSSADFGLVHKKIDEHNVSWRGGVNWKPLDDTLIYANVSRGFKGGNFPTLSGLFEAAYDAVKQEQVTSYEAGFKIRPFGNILQLNGAVYHSDYINKQLYAFISNPVFGTAESTVNIPKSKVDGAELEAILHPLDGLTLRTDVNYTKTKIKESPACISPAVTPATCVFSGNSYPSYPGGPTSTQLDLKGESFNLAPEWTANADVEYSWGLTETMKALVGMSALYQSEQTPTIGASTGQVVGGFTTIDQTMPAYTTLDLRAGLESDKGTWRVTLWGRNITNKEYTTAIARGFDTTARYTGMPRTYGITLGYNYD